jgi:hypothetical protein
MKICDICDGKITNEIKVGCSLDDIAKARLYQEEIIHVSVSIDKGDVCDDCRDHLHKFLRFEVEQMKGRK